MACLKTMAASQDIGVAAVATVLSEQGSKTLTDFVDGNRVFAHSTGFSQSLVSQLAPLVEALPYC